MGKMWWKINKIFPLLSYFAWVQFPHFLSIPPTESQKKYKKLVNERNFQKSRARRLFLFVKREINAKRFILHTNYVLQEWIKSNCEASPSTQFFELMLTFLLNFMFFQRAVVFGDIWLNVARFFAIIEPKAHLNPIKPLNLLNWLQHFTNLFSFGKKVGSAGEINGYEWTLSDHRALRTLLSLILTLALVLPRLEFRIIHLETFVTFSLV